MTRTITLRKTLLATCISAALIGGTLPASASGLQNQLDRVFDGMSNVTPPGVWESQRRGVITGGRITTKVPIMTESLVRVTPPSWKGSCGGVDMHLGSFSFINSEQMVQLLRSVAANAQGYVFQLALDNVFPQGAKWIENFQKKIQALNRAMLNSCEAAQGVVNDTISAMGFSSEVKGMTEASATGMVDDFFSGFSESSGKPTVKLLEEVDAPRRKEMLGNVVWKELRRHGVQSWFHGGDVQLLEAIMSISGTIIVGEATDEGETPITTIAGNKLTLADLIDGGTVQMYDCGGDTTECKMDSGSTTTSVNIKGFGQHIQDMLLGNASSPGIIGKMSVNTGALTNEEEAFMANLPGSAATFLRNLVIANPSTARLFAEESSKALALNITYSIASEMLRAAEQAIGSSNNDWAAKAVTSLHESSARLSQEYTMLANEYGTMNDLVRDYSALIENTRVARYTLREMSKGGGQ